MTKLDQKKVHHKKFLTSDYNVYETCDAASMMHSSVNDKKSTVQTPTSKIVNVNEIVKQMANETANGGFVTSMP